MRIYDKEIMNFIESGVKNKVSFNIFLFIMLMGPGGLLLAVN